MKSLRTLNALDHYGAAARRESSAIPDLGVYSPAVQVTEDFALQSYFDSTLYQLAILTQYPNQPIVASTVKSPDIAGYAVALHPASETPVAIQFKSAKSEGSGASSTLVLKPGEILRPTDGPFTGFTWGLPFGWLGGGVATLVVFITPHASVDWSTDERELLFHRVRLPIVAPASVPTVALGRIDWPIRFPWLNAYGGSTNSPQLGNASIGVVPTKVQLIPRVTAVTNPPTIRFLLAQFDDYARTSTNTLNSTIGTFDAVIPTHANPVGMAQQTTNYSVVEYTSGALLGGGDAAVVTLMDMDDGDDIAGVEVDILRYGKL